MVIWSSVKTVSCMCGYKRSDGSMVRWAMIESSLSSCNHVYTCALFTVYEGTIVPSTSMMLSITKGAPNAVLDASYVEPSVTMFDDPNTVAQKVSMSVASTSYVNTAIFTLGELVPENVAESMLNLPLV